jgi:GlpG protein
MARPMRRLEHFPTADEASALIDVLYAAGIRAAALPTREGGVDVWVEDEKRIHEAGALAAELGAAPDDPRFAEARRRAAEQRKASAKQERQTAARVVHVRERFAVTGRIGPVTLLLGLACVAVAVLTTTPAGLAQLHLGDRTDVVSWFAYQSYVAEGGYHRWYPGLPDLRAWQLWRLFTPSLVHFGVLHIVFNLWWLFDLGNAIERRQRSWLLALMVLVLAAGSNSLQYAFGPSPAFGGMSGVVYGLFAYLWLRGRFDPASGYAVSVQTVVWMLGFYVLCWTGQIGSVANMAHTGGLVLGAAWGFLASGWLGRALHR